MTTTRQPPTGIRRILFRMPITAYRWHLGWLFGERFVLLNHVGRKTGLPRQAVVEVVRHDPATDCVVVSSGFGEGSQWYQNVMAQPDLTIQLGSRTLAVHAERLPVEQAQEEMLGYARRHPTAARKLSGYMGFASDGTEETYRKVGEVLPFIRMRPR